MKEKRIKFYSTLLIAFCLILVSIVLFGVFARKRCTMLSDGHSSNCTDSAAFECSTISYMTMETSSMTINLYCPWYRRDVGFGEAALAVSMLFLILVGLRKYYKSFCARLTRICTGFLGVLLLLTAMTLMFIDLNDVRTSSSAGASGFTSDRSPYVANGVLVILLSVFVLGLTVWETKKYLRNLRKCKKADRKTKYNETEAVQIKTTCQVD